jgi:hypothetical protein
MFGESAKVFARAINLSDRGACVKVPKGFRTDIGEILSVEGRLIGVKRLFVIVGLSGDNLHLAACP